MEINNSKLDLSIVIPCLNEAETIVKCINKCKNKIAKLNINAEVIVADNGSTDSSIELAQKAGAKIVKVKKEVMEVH